MSEVHRLARRYNDALISRGDHSREWFVDSMGELRLRTKNSVQRRFELDERREAAEIGGYLCDEMGVCG